MYCKAQLRRIERNRDRIDALGADLLVLTADSPEVIEAAGFDLPIASVSPALWAELGIENPERPGLPHPTTVVLAPDGTVLLRQSFVDYRDRLPIPDMLAAIEQGAAPGPSPQPSATDWAAGVTFTTGGADDCLSLTAAVADGFHLYGAKETTARPLALAVDQAPDWSPHIPDGTEKTLPGLGTSWVLTGQTTIEWPLPDGLPRRLTGTIHYQLCTDTTCSPPGSQPFTVDRIAGPCTTPDQLAP